MNKPWREYQRECFQTHFRIIEGYAETGASALVSSLKVQFEILQTCPDWVMLTVDELDRLAVLCRGAGLADQARLFQEAGIDLACAAGPCCKYFGDLSAS